MNCSLIRKIKIHQITHVLTKKELEIIKFTESKIKDLIIFNDDKYPTSTFYMSSKGKWILEEDFINNKLYIRYEDFWSVLNRKFKMKNDDIQMFLKYMIEKKFKEISKFSYKYTYTFLLFAVERDFKS